MTEEKAHLISSYTPFVTLLTMYPPEGFAASRLHQNDMDAFLPAGHERRFSLGSHRVQMTFCLVFYSHFFVGSHSTWRLDYTLDLAVFGAPL